MTDNNKVLGIPLDIEDADGMSISPVAALVVVEGFDAEGNTVYGVMHTEGVTTVQALGFARYAVLHAETSVLRDSIVFENQSPS